VSADVLFLLDVDNTLLDNDRFVADLGRHLASELGGANAERYWRIFGTMRDEAGFVDYLGALQRLRAELVDDATSVRLLRMAGFLLEYPFAERLYPGALEVLARLGRVGPTVILSDGDVVLQPRKIERAGLWNATSGRVLIYVQKETMLTSVQRLYPARRYVMVDDKLRLLSEIKKVWGERVVTVFARQGHYALDPAALDRYPAADVTIERIDELLELDPESWLEAAAQEKP
jgi:FMN phosphatase YigB (HAD superfamily)